MKKQQKTPIKLFFKITICSFLCLLCLVFGFFIYYFAVTSGTKLNVSALSLNTENNSLILNENGDNAFIIGGGKKTKLKELSPHTINAFISIEDKRFYSHHGVDYFRTAGAMFNNLKSLKLKEGGSTISQQLVKNTSLSREKTLSRKLKEIKLAKELEKIFSKNEILELYLNSIYFGGGCYGITEASSYYFSKEPKNLSLSESAFLAAVINAPALYNPQTNLELATKRKNLVLSEMKKDGRITEEEYKKAIIQPLEFTYFKPNNAFYKTAIAEAANLLNLTENSIASAGLKLHTNLNTTLQNYLDELIKNENIFDGKNNNNPFASIMVLDNNNSCVIAYSSNNNVLPASIKRQSGSVLKPLAVYAPALESGKIYPSSILLDEEININGYAPENADGKYHGFVSARKALEKSLNVPAVKIMEMVSPQKSIEFLKGFGINLNEEDANLSLSLGATKNGISELELAGGYMALANYGKYCSPHFITKIEDKNGKIIYENKNIKTTACTKETAFQVLDMLCGVTTNGTAKRIGDLGYNVASKTGTVGLKNTSKNSDAYSISLTTSHTILSHVYSSEKPLNKSVNGSTYPTIFNKFVLKELYKNGAPNNFSSPEGIVRKNIDTFIEANEHKIVLAPIGTPQRFIREELFNSSFLPPETFANNSLEIKGVIDSGSPTISLKTNNNSTYKLYRNGEEINRFAGNGEIVVLEDFAAKHGNILDYFIIETNYRGEQILSNSVKIFCI